ncbi:DUF4177 domain-containing protein [Lentibacter algarum]|uniref:DUF4177 domain-containing protein n=1 Tax=Lentibacter algarum TaxID=576131 RepID=UPI001C084944|nr:DUF4177 domain-containing protein [Lentibacter algarum]
MFEYKVVPAPKRGIKAKGVKTHEARFSHALQQLMNEEAAAGWEFSRAETLPSEEKSGFRSATVVYRSVLIFRKPILVEQETYHEPVAAVPVPAPVPEVMLEPEYEEPRITAEASDFEEPDQESSNAKA